MQRTLMFSLLMAAGLTHAGEWSQAPSDAVLTPLSVQRVMANGEGYVLLGHAGIDLIVSVDSDVNVQSQTLDYSQLAGQPIHFHAARAVGQDRFLLRTVIDPVNSLCRLDLIDSAGRVQTRTAHPFELDGSCLSTASSPALDGGGGLWINRANTRFASRVQSDGEVLAITAPDGVTDGFQFAPLPGAAAAYALYRDQQRWTLARIDGNQPTWSKAPVDLNLQYRHVFATDEGDALVVGRIGPDFAAGVLYLARYSPQGALLWERSYPGLEPLQLSATRQAADGRLLIAVTPSLGGKTVLYSFSSGGELEWSRDFGDEYFQGFVEGPSADPLEAPAEVAYILGTRSPSNINNVISALELLDANGQLQLRRPAERRSVWQSALLSDGSLVMVENQGDGSQQLNHFGPDGTPRAAPDLLELQPALAPRLLNATLGADGSSYSLVKLGDKDAGLRAWSEAGELLWQQTLPGPDNRLLEPYADPARLSANKIVSNSERVCVGPLRYRSNGFAGFTIPSDVTRCLDRNDGSISFSETVGASGVGRSIAALGLLPDNRLITFTSSCIDCADATVNRIERAGDSNNAQTTSLSQGDLNMGSRVPFDDAPNAVAHVADDGRTTLVAGNITTPLQLIQYSTTGEVSRTALNELSRGIVLRLTQQSNGAFLLHSWSNDRHSLSLFSTAGALRWTHGFSGPLALASGHPALAFASANDAVLITRQTHIEGHVQSELLVLEASTGVVRWQQPVSEGLGRGVRSLSIDSTRGLALVSSDRPGEAILSAYALSDGERRGNRALPCSEIACTPLGIDVGNDGSLRVFGAGSEVSRRELDTTLSPAAAGQKAIAGTWYTPATNGQGLQLDYNPASGDVFGAWFTFIDANQFGVKGLRWYSLGGVTAQGADVMRLDIYRNQGGRFASGPVTDAETVGYAELRLQDCSHSVLSYVFQHGELSGLSGDIPLQRLTPSALDCVEADGQTAAAQPAQPALSSSFSTSQRGAWYTPETSGQGLLFDIRPPSADGSDRGLVLAGWFSYDIESDDPTAQHWFLLQGEIGQALGGEVELDVYRATGGRFDQLGTESVHTVGRARLRFNGCEQGSLSYQFDNNDLAGSFAGKQGTIPLSKLLPCQSEAQR